MNNYGEFSGSRFEKSGTIARIGTAEIDLSSKFSTYQQENLSNLYRLAGHIYSSADLRKLRAEGRPEFEWNLFLPIILSIVGNFKSAIPGLDFFGVSEDDQRGANLHKKLNEYAFYTANDISYELAKAFFYAVVTRMGWLKTTWSYTKDDQGMVDIKWYDPFRLKFDTAWQRRDTSDLRFISDTGWYEASEIIDTFARKDPLMRDEIYEKATLIVGESSMKSGRMRKMMATWAERFLNSSIDYQGRKHGHDSFGESLNYNFGGTWYRGDGRFKVIDWYEKRLEPMMEIHDLTTNQKEDVTEDVAISKDRSDRIGSSREWFDREKLAIIRERYNNPKVTVKHQELIWQTSVVPALNMVLHDAPQKFQSGHFKFIPVLCFDFHSDPMEFKSVMDHIVDPVSSYNLRRNTLLTYLMKLSNGGFVAEASAVKGYEDSLLSNEIGGLSIVADGSLAQKRVIQKQPPPYPDGLRLFNQEEKQDLEMISGSTPNTRGLKENTNESGILFEAKVQQSDILQEWISDNAQASLIYTAENVFTMFQRFMKMPRVLLLLQDQTNPSWLKVNMYYLGKMMNDVSYGKFNIRISKQPFGRLAQQKEFQIVMQINDWLAKTFGAQFVDPRIAIKLSGISAAPDMIQHINSALGDLLQQDQAAEMMQAEQDNQNRMRSQMEMMSMMQQFSGGQLQNRKLSAEMASNSIVKGISSGNRSKAGSRSNTNQLNQLITQ